MGGGRGGRPLGAAPGPGSLRGSAPDLFDGIEHTWKRLPGGAAIDAILSQAIREFDWQHPDATIPLLAKARPLIAAISDPLAKLKLAELDETVAALRRHLGRRAGPRGQCDPRLARRRGHDCRRAGAGELTRPSIVAGKCLDRQALDAPGRRGRPANPGLRS